MINNKKKSYKIYDVKWHSLDNHRQTKRPNVKSLLVEMYYQ